MAFNAGAIKGHMELDRSPFTQGLAQARRQGKQFAKNRWTATVSVDVSRARNQVRALRSDLRNLNALSRHVQINANTQAASAQIKALQQQTSAFGRSRATATTGVDTARATAQVAALQQRVNAYGRTRANAHLGVTGTAAAAAQTQALQQQVNAHGRTRANAHVGVTGAAAATAQVSVLQLALIGLGPAVIPVLAVLIGQTLALAGALGAAAGALGIFGLAAAGEIKTLLDFHKEMGRLDTAIDAASGDLEKQAALIKERKELMASLSPAQRAVVTSLGELSTAFTNFGSAARPQVLGTFTNILNGLTSALKILKPVVPAVAQTVFALSQRFEQAMSGPGMEAFRDWVEYYGPAAILWLVNTLVNLGATVVNLVAAFDPLTDKLLDVGGAFQSMREWSAGLKGSPEFNEFLRYVATNGPLVSDTLLALANAVLQVAWALAPVAPPILTVIGVLATLVANLAQAHPWMIQLAWGALLLAKVWGPMAAGIGLVTTALRSQAALWLLMKVRMVAYQIAMLAVRAATMLWTAAQWLLNIALNANPISLLIIAIVAAVALVVGAILYAWYNFDWFRNGVLAVWAAIQFGAMWLWTNGIQPVVNFIVNAFMTYLLPAIQFFVGLYVSYITTMWSVVQTLWSFIWPIIQFIAYVAFALLMTYVGLLVAAWRTAFNAMAAAGMWLWTNVVSPVVTWIVAKYRAYLVPALVWVQQRWNQLMNLLGAALRWLWSNVVSPVLAWIVSKFMWLYGRYLYYKILLQAVFRMIGDYANSLKNRIGAAFDKAREFGNRLLNAFRAVRDSVKEVFRSMANHARKPINWVINTVYNDGLRKIARSTLNAVGMSKLADKIPRAATIPAFAAGGSPMDPTGFVRGRGSATSDQIDARLSNREFVINARSTARWRPVLEWINNQGRRGGSAAATPAGPGAAAGLPGFAGGGFLSDALALAKDAVLGASRDALKSALDALGWSGWIRELKAGAPVWKGTAGGAMDMAATGVLDYLKKEDAKGGGVMGVVKQARKAKMNGSDASNDYTRAFGMIGAPWCAMFVSEMIKRAKAGKLYKGEPSAAVSSFANSGMKSVGVGAGKPGDLAVYPGSGPGGWQHINIVTDPKRRQSIGGNENNAIRTQYGYYTSRAAKLMRPGLAQGGIPDDAWRNILGQDYATNTWRTTPLATQFYRVLAGLPAYAGGGTASEGPALLGEQGPELVEFGSRARVRTAAETADVLAEAIVRAMERMGHTSSGPATAAAAQVVVNGLATEEIIEEIVRRLRAEAEMAKATTAAGMAPKPRG